MIAAVLIPMVAGPFIGAAVIVGAAETYVDLGVVKQVPTPWIFPAAAAVAVLVVVPVLLLRRHGTGGVDAAAPAVTEAPVTETPVTETPVTETPVTEPPA